MTVIAYLQTPIDAHYLRTLLIGLDAVVSVNDDGVLVIETPDAPTIRTSGQTTTTTAKAAFGAFKDWESPEDQVYDERDAAWVRKCRASERHAYAAALSDARDAVAAEHESASVDYSAGYLLGMKDALAAIDALKEDSDG